MSTEYRIASIADFLAVPAEKQDELLRDFSTWLDAARKHEEISRHATVMLGGAVTFRTDSFTWIDDGVAGCSAFDVRDDGNDNVVRVHFGAAPAHPGEQKEGRS